MKFLSSLLLLSAASLTAAPAPSDSTKALGLTEARAMALKTHPRITVAELRALAARESVTEARSNFFPTLTANATAVGVGETNTRLAIGSLSSSQTYDHVGVGANGSLLITDFGRTSNLTGAAQFRERAAKANVLATRAELLLEVDASFFSALEARALKTVADKTLEVRRSILDQISALANSRLKSELDVRFAQVNVDDARLLVDQAEKNWQTALATLSNLIGERTVVTASLLDEPALASELPSAVDPLVDLALRQRPELTRQEAERDAAKNTARAARDARLPTVSAMGSAGVVPIGDEHFVHNFAAAAVNVTMPLFAGGLYRARQREAELQAASGDAALLDIQNNVVRDVRVAWLEAVHARERISLTASLLENSSSTLELARARFEQGLSSVIELNQAELAQTSAEIANTNAKYDYRLRRDILDFQTGSMR